MIAQIFVSNSLPARQKVMLEELIKNELKLDHPDVLFIASDEKLGIEQARAIKDFFTLKPYQAKGKAVVVEELANISIDSQNALLKILEEPPLEAIILLGASNLNNLLPTVLSRCQVTVIDSEIGGKKSELPNAKKVLSLPIIDRFQLVEKTDNKDALLDELVEYTSELFAKDHRHLTTVKKVLEAEGFKKSNVNIRGILEYLMLVLPKI